MSLPRSARASSHTPRVWARPDWLFGSPSRCTPDGLLLCGWSPCRERWGQHAHRAALDLAQLCAGKTKPLRRLGDRTGMGAATDAVAQFDDLACSPLQGSKPAGNSVSECGAWL